MTIQMKRCPGCGQLAEPQELVCPTCGHHYRTHLLVQGGASSPPRPVHLPPRRVSPFLITWACLWAAYATVFLLDFLIHLARDKGTPFPLFEVFVMLGCLNIITALGMVILGALRP